jgi:hypothetical protein
MINPNKCYNDSGVFGLTFKGTAAELAAVPDGLWTPAEGDIWFDTTNDAWKQFNGSEWVPFGTVNLAMTGAAAGETIPDGVTFITVTSANAAHWVNLPTPTPGAELWIASAGGTGWELRSAAPETTAINGNTPTAGHESAVAATDLLTRCKCMSAVAWIVTHFASDGTESAADPAS